MSEVTIGPAHHDELSGILAMCQETFETHAELLPDYFDNGNFQRGLLKKHKQSFIHFRFLLRDHSKSIYAARKDGTLVGYVSLSDEGPKVLIDDIYVIPEARKNGVANQLVQHVIKVSKIRGHAELSAVVWRGNVSSETLFKRVGFEPDFKVFSMKTDAPPAPVRPWWRNNLHWIGSVIVFLGFGVLAFLGR